MQAVSWLVVGGSVRAVRRLRVRTGHTYDPYVRLVRIDLKEEIETENKYRRINWDRKSVSFWTLIFLRSNTVRPSGGIYFGFRVLWLTLFDLHIS